MGIQQMLMATMHRTQTLHVGGTLKVRGVCIELDVRQQVEPHLPTIMSSLSVACGLMRVQMSMVNRVLLLLKMEAKEDMRAASITANIRPRNPAQTDIRKEGE